MRIDAAYHAKEITMASTLTKILIHITFSTKHRDPLIHESIETDLFAYIGGICRRMGSPLHAMNGTSTHVHLLVSLSKTVALSELMLDIKRDSSKWIKEHDPDGAGFAWQEGYFAFSIGQSGVDDLKAYIENQKEHHKTKSFEDEVRAFLKKYEMEWDEAFMWD